jgi:hypothetical protein
MDELNLLQAIRLKGRVRPGELAATLDSDEVEVGSVVKELTGAGLLIEGKAIRLSPAGRARLDALLADERRDVDSAAFEKTYNAFRGVNASLKSLVTDWQLKDGEPNDHLDADYDAGVLSRLEDLHDDVLPILASVSNQLPRLAAYATKLTAALEKVRAGDVTWLTRPVIDSYHTVWFELHEELIEAAGLTREAEATAGHAE